MSKVRKYLKMEADVEFFACVHGASLIFLYGCIQWLNGIEEVPFSVIFQQMVLGYAIAWIQKGLFWKETTYTRVEYGIREVMWNVIPIVLIVVTGQVFEWLPGVSRWIEVAFYIVIGCYFIMVWLFLKYIYKKETEEINQLLKNRRERGEEDECCF